MVSVMVGGYEGMWIDLVLTSVEKKTARNGATYYKLRGEVDWEDFGEALYVWDEKLIAEIEKRNLKAGDGVVLFVVRNGKGFYTVKAISSVLTEEEVEEVEQWDVVCPRCGCGYTKEEAEFYKRCQGCGAWFEL